VFVQYRDRFNPVVAVRKTCGGCSPLRGSRQGANRHLALSGLIVLVASFTYAGPAQSFDSGIIDFCYYQYGATIPYGPGPAAIGSAGDLWNSAQITMSLSPLLNVSGLTTDVAWAVSSGGGISGGLGGTYGWLFSTATGIYTASISGLTPGARYNLYLYGSWNGANPIMINGVSFSPPAVRDTLSLNQGSQYDVETVIADSSGQLTFTPSGGYSYVTSWQLTPVPEPGAYPLFLIGLTFLFFARRAADAESAPVP
jgi:hypothetical protein